MKKNKMTYKSLTALVFVLMLVGCSDDFEQGEKRILNLVPYVSSYSYADQSNNSRTRAVTTPEGYENFLTAYPTSAAEVGRIKIFLAHKDNSSSWVCKSGGEFFYSGSSWQSTVQVEASTQYYVYGYMPAGSASATITSENYATGATLTLSGLSVLNPVDVCAIVGVKKSTDTSDFVAGQYGYFTDDSSADDNLYLLLEHIYSKVDFQFAVDAGYDELRTIKLKSVEMELPSGTKTTMKTTINLLADKAKPMTCTYDYEGSTDASKATLLNTETELTTTYQSVSGYVLPAKDNNLSFNLTSKYDVYDEKGYCVRTDCTAKNKITITAAEAGKNYTIKMLVQPTYLYQLSQPDLDNPTIVLQ